MLKVELEPLYLALEPPEHVLTCHEDAEPHALAAWLLKNYPDALQSALKVQKVSPSSLRASSSSFVVSPAPQTAPARDGDETDALTQPTNNGTNNNNNPVNKMEILDCIAQAQRMFLQRQPLTEVFQCLLAGILRVHQNQFAFVGEMLHTPDNEPCLRAYCRAWTPDQHEAFSFDHPMSIHVENWDNLLGHAILHKQVVIANDVRNDPRASGRTPPGHIALENFLGVPLVQDNAVIGMLGVANRSGGYTEAHVDSLEAFSLTCSSMIQAAAQRQENEHLINSLECKVQERTQRLLQANTELAAANRRVVQASEMRLQHFACMSHEIRTPLNCIIGLSSLLQESKLSPMQDESIRMIVASGDLLLTVVNDVLDYAKLESGHVEINVQRSNLQETLNAMIHSIQTKAASKEIPLRTYYDPAVPEFCQTDCRRLQQILYNLLGNAIKFSPAATPVEFGVLLCRRDTQPRQGEYYPHLAESSSDGWAAPDSDNEDKDEATTKHTSAAPHHASLLLHKRKSFARPHSFHDDDTMVLRFVIKDYGQGLGPQDFDHIFEPFRQASRETEQVYGGTGLGLAITGKLVAALGGTISVASQKGQWTRFTVDIPFHDAPVSLARLARGLANATILLVGQNCPDRAQVCHYFAEFNLDLKVFNTSAELDQAISTQGFLQHERSYICLIQEDCYDADTYALLTDMTSSAVLLTYGPDFCVQKSEGHFRSLCQVLPSVLIKSMISALKSSRSVRESFGMHRQHSFKAIQALYHDYRILVAEDNKVNQKVLLRMLNRIGVDRVRIVNNGQEAVQAEQKHDFDVILMDMQMPVLDGLGACKQILARTDRRQRPPSVVFVTANVSHSFEMACSEAGGSGFLTKPFDIPELENVLRKTYLAREVNSSDEDASEVLTE